MEKRIITVGQNSGELIGNNHIVIQSAIDYLHAVGGGTVKIGEGVYNIDSSVHLRSGVNLEGVPGKTILQKGAEKISSLAVDADHFEQEITVVHPELFSPGQSVTVRSDTVPGDFYVTVATVTAKKDNICYLDKQIEAHIRLKDNGQVSTNFPVISGYNCDHLFVRNLRIEGNKEQNSEVNGCLNGGIYLFEAQQIDLENCVVENYNGDGFSYQCCEDITLRHCKSLNNGAKGFHPGSGTKRTIIKDCTASENGKEGIFVCWGIKNSVIESCNSFSNAWSGLSIGHKDTHNIIRNNRFSDNHSYGILFRNESASLGANYNKVENNVIEDNGSEETGYAGIRVRGFTHDVDICDNKISFSKASLTQTIGICMEENTKDIHLESNDFSGCFKHTHSSC